MTITSLRIATDLWKWLRIQAVKCDCSTNELICRVLSDYKNREEQ